MMCLKAAVGHLASYTVCTSHLIRQMLRTKSQRCANLLLFRSYNQRSWRFVFDLFSVSMYFSKLPVHHPYTAQENVYQVYWIVKIVSACRRARRFWYHQNYPCWSRRTFLYFFLPRFVIRISYNVLFCASSFLEHQCIAGQTGLHYVTFLQI